MDRLIKEQLAYIAGFFDGEGCIHIGGRRRNSTYNLEVSITNTNKEILDWVCRCFGGSVKAHAKAKDHHRQCFTWRVVSNEAMEFLQSILLFLNVKYEQAELAITFQEYKRNIPKGRPRNWRRPQWHVDIEGFCYDTLKEMHKR